MLLTETRIPAAPKLSRTQKPPDMSVEAWQIQLRRAYGRLQEYQVEPDPRDGQLGEYRVTNPSSSRTYTVILRGDARDNSCTCPDHKTNTLGTCKHVEYCLSLLEETPEGQAALQVLMGSLDRVKETGRIRPIETTVVAGQFLSATHGWLLLTIAGAFDLNQEGRDILGQLAVNLMVGLGDSREAAEHSLATAATRIPPSPALSS